MAVTYVKDFSFPSDFGFHKNGSASVPGKAKGGSTTPQRYRDGGKIQSPQSKYAGHSSKHDDSPKTGAGAGKPVYGSTGVQPKTTGEKSSGLQAPAFKHGGKSGRHEKMMKDHMKRRDGGSIDVAEGKVKDGAKSPWNKDDGVSPGSSKRTPPKQGEKNSSAAKSKFATEGRNTEPATKQTGDVERMSEFSDFKKGGKVHKKAKGGKVHADRFEKADHGGKDDHKVAAPVKRVKKDHQAMDGGEKAGMHKDRASNMGSVPKAGGKDTKKSSTPYDFKGGGHASGCACGKCGGGSVKKAADGGRIKNLGHYAHGGKVKAEKYEKAAGTPKKSGDGSKGEHKSGKAEGKHTAPAQGEKRMANGGLSRGTGAKKNAAIHAKGKKPGAGPGALAAIAGLLGGSGPGPSMPHPQGPGMGMAPPPGMAPGMGSPPGGQMGGMAPPGAPRMGMSHGGGVKHVIVHHVSHKA